MSDSSLHLPFPAICDTNNGCSSLVSGTGHWRNRRISGCPCQGACPVMRKSASRMSNTAAHCCDEHIPWGDGDWGSPHRGIMPDLCHQDYIGPQEIILQMQRNAGHFSDLQLVFKMAGAQGTYPSICQGIKLERQTGTRLVLMQKLHAQNKPFLTASVHRSCTRLCVVGFKHTVDNEH